MLTHIQIWNAIDALAERQGLTPSALARKAGLDATTFNRSKRQSADGNPRWPSTESIAKILSATGVSIDDFLSLIGGEGDASLPFQLLDTLDGSAFDSAGRPSGPNWDQFMPLSRAEGDCFAIGISGDGYLPTYPDGAVLLASPKAQRRRGDRVLVETNGRLMLAELVHETARQIQLRPLDGSTMPVLKASEARILARILWVSQ